MAAGRAMRRRQIVHTFGLAALGTVVAGCARTVVPIPTTPRAAVSPPSPTTLVIPQATIPPPTSTVPAFTATPRPTPRIVASATPAPTKSMKVPAPSAAAGGKPSFSDVAQRTPADVLLYLQGQLPGYPNGSPAAAINFSASDILETMDTAVLDELSQREGSAALQQMYDVIAHDILTTLRDLYPEQWTLLALDAGHGGNKAFYWDPGSDGTEAIHTRAVAASVLKQAQQPAFARVIVRPIFNDSIPDDFGPNAPINRPSINMTLIRQVRASMLASEATTWNETHPAKTDQVMVHEISVHFNVGANGALVLHQGDTVRPEFAARSLDFAKHYLTRVTTDLNATGRLPSHLGLWNGTGLHDDVMMYRPSSMPSTANPNIVLRYGALQGNGYAPRYIARLLGHPSTSKTDAGAPRSHAGNS